jgi:hypothetical protein
MGGIYRIFGFEEDWNKPRCLIELAWRWQWVEEDEKGFEKSNWIGWDISVVQKGLVILTFKFLSKD